MSTENEHDATLHLCLGQARTRSTSFLWRRCILTNIQDSHGSTQGARGME